jgi:hypothetical protein
MKWTEGAYFAAWMNMLGNDWRLTALHSGTEAEALKAMHELRDEYRKMQEQENMLEQERV